MTDIDRGPIDYRLVARLVTAHNRAVEASQRGGNPHSQAIIHLAETLANTPPAEAKVVYPSMEQNNGQ